MEENDSRKHTEHIAKAHHWVCHTKWKMFYYIHPKYRTQPETHSASGKLPVGKQTNPEIRSPPERLHP